ncbi:hypothetical protein AVEN_19398-1 [Araneus ventricosus]|uniref:Uncharacterized protein n=1 Tax=Araneus ventricosus TaxID=182803 RepID=A0A4Y2C675_ARAVE|nr:hypothetical protein AVEN_19398-1 [Araneus ventricosus]
MAKDVLFVSVGCLHLGCTAVKVFGSFNGGSPSLSSVTGYMRNIFKTEEPESQRSTKHLKIQHDVKRKDDPRLDITDSMISDSSKHDFDENLIVGSFVIVFGLITLLDIFFLEDLTRFSRQ